MITEIRMREISDILYKYDIGKEELNKYTKQKSFLENYKFPIGTPVETKEFVRCLLDNYYINAKFNHIANSWISRGQFNIDLLNVRPQ